MGRCAHRLIVELGDGTSRYDDCPERAAGSAWGRACPIHACLVPGCDQVTDYFVADRPLIANYCASHRPEFCAEVGCGRADPDKGGFCSAHGLCPGCGGRREWVGRILCERCYQCIQSQISGHARRTRLAGAGGQFTWATLAARFAYFGNRCYICGAHDEPLVIEHIKPVAKGGSSWPSNLRPACKSCNSSNSDQWPGVALFGELVIRLRHRQRF